MKKLILLLFISTASFSQEKRFAVSIVQDARLAFKGDDRGNDAFTTNFIVNFELQGRDKGHGYGIIMPTLEYADLDSGYYYRYGVSGGWTFTQFTHFDFTPYIGLGAISRKLKSWNGENTFFPSFAVGLDISIHLIDNLDLVLLNQLTDRKDLKMIYDSKQYFNYSFYIGLKLKI